jgi:hypothetical protein
MKARKFFTSSWGVIFIVVAITVVIVVPLTTHSIDQQRQTMHKAKAFDGLVVKVLDLQVLEGGDSGGGYQRFRMVAVDIVEAKRYIWYIGKGTQFYAFLEENAVIAGDMIAISYRETVVTGSSAGIFSFLRFSKPPP